MAMVLMEISPCGEGARAGKKEEVKDKFEFVLEVRVEVMITLSNSVLPIIQPVAL